MDTLSRRQVLGSLGLTAGASLLAGCGESLHGATKDQSTDSAGHKIAGRDWQYVRLDPDFIAKEAYRLMPEGGCMYGLFAGIITAIARLQGEPFSSFPLHMMKYGEGGVGLWGSLCGAVNGGSAIIGLFEPTKERRESLIAQLFSWYETAELPTYRPDMHGDSEEIPKSVSRSVLCHASVGKWCKASGSQVGSPEMKERCRRLTAEVSAKTVKLLNGNLEQSCKFTGLDAEVRSCLSCHGKDLHDSMGKMQCGTCHQQLSTKHPAVPKIAE
jgi:hypothetical protein